MNDPELKALGEVTKALVDLTEEQRRNVLLYVNARYGGQVAPIRRQTNPAESEIAPGASTQFASIGDLFDAVNPQTEAERVLAVAYWLQSVEGSADFESYPVNKHLKHLGHPVSNITRALDSMISQTPRLILQTSKSGSAKQARKRYKMTREGIKRVQSLIDQNSGDANGN
jgi:hypothetical protein